MENFSNYILNIKNLKHNFNAIKKQVGTSVKVCAMVKGDAYGHGVRDVCENIEADFFGVASAYEAKEIRQFNFKTPILVVGMLNFDMLTYCATNNVSVAISSLLELKQIEKSNLEKPIKIHIKVNSGLNRIGVKDLTEFKKMLKFVEQSKNIVLEGLFTHFATKLEDLNFVEKQHNVFKKFVDLVDQKQVIVHCCNSFATLKFPEFHYGMVRCGYNLYGWQNYEKQLFKPVLSIKSKIVFVHKVKKGETVGYDRTFKMLQNGKIAIVPLGYADGFDRKLSNNFKVLVNGKWANVVGNVCMDVFMVDVSNIKVKVGDEVTILGKCGINEITPYTYAKTLNTSAYEILLKFRSERMNRILQ